MFLFFASTHAFGRKKTHWLIVFPVFTLLAFLTLYTHPLLLFPTGFLWLFFITKNDWPFSRKQTLLFSAILIALAFSKLLLSTSSSSHYDVDRLQRATHPTLQTILEALQSPLAKEIVKRTLWNYWIVPVLFLTGLMATLRRKAYWHSILTIGFAFLYFLALCITFNDFTPFYMESELMPASILLTAPFAFYVLPQLNARSLAILLATIFLVRLAYIGYASPKWVERKNWLLSTLQAMRQQRITKALIYEDEANKKILIMNWGTPTESMIASALKGDKPQLTFVIDKPDNLVHRMPPDPSSMISCFETYSNKSLNHFYFSIDTTAGYRVIKLK